MWSEYSVGARVAVPGKQYIRRKLIMSFDGKAKVFLHGNKLLEIIDSVAWPKIFRSLFIVSSQMTLILRILDQACSRAGFAQRRCLASNPGPSNPIPAKACYLRPQQRLPVSVSKESCRSYATGRQGSPGGTHRMNLGKDQDEEKSALEKFGVDLTSKARDGKLDPVIGRDSVR